MPLYSFGRSPRRGKVLGLDCRWAAALADDRGVIFTRTNGLVYEALIPALECRPLRSIWTNTHSVAVLTDPGRIAISRWDGRITLHEPTHYSQVAELDTGRGPVHRLQWWPRHRILAAFCGTDVSRPWLQFWDVQKGVRLWEVQPELVGRGFSSADHEGVIYQSFDDHLIGLSKACPLVGPHVAGDPPGRGNRAGQSEVIAARAGGRI